MNQLEASFSQGKLFRFAPRAVVDIDAPVERVWSILTDFARYQEWNRFTPSVACAGKVGDPVLMQVCFPGRRPMRQRETLNVFEPPQRLAWGMRMGINAFLVANRYQILEPLDGHRTRYTTVDYLSGALAPLVEALYGRDMEAGFALAAAGLKQAAER
ncbi:MAG TPA: SRPBCC domain-containing protein [Candidatus Binatia bacterium]|nr:SRPBCC domain-containing protein [Candidatus Binatia bacterium]